MTLRPRSLCRLPSATAFAAACALVPACGSGDAVRDPGQALPDLSDARFQLTRAADCDDLLTRIQDSILVQLELRAEELKQGEAYGGRGVVIGGVPTAGDVELDEDSASVPPSVAPVPNGVGASGTPGAANGAGADPAVPADPGAAPGEGGGFSGTTVQVAGVDEADIVKTDGDDIYLLHGGTLFVLRGWPADATEIRGSILVEGTPVEMFVASGKAVVFSRVYANLSDGSAASDQWYANAGYTKLSVFDVGDGTPTLLRESFVEGEYNAARRHGELVRAVVQDGFKIPPLGSPSIEYRDPFGNPYPQGDIDAQVDDWLERTSRSIRSTELQDWLPRQFERQGERLVAVAPRCQDHYSPDPGLTESGVTSVVSLDLGDTSAPLGGATILGRAERVYSNEDVLLVTQTDYRPRLDAVWTEQTIIHRFELADSATAYTASGAVAGSIHDQFSLDERDGIIRVSTTEQLGWGAGGAVAVPPTPARPQPTEPAPGGVALPTEDASNAPASGGASSSGDGGAGGAASASDPTAPVSDPTPSAEPAPVPQPGPGAEPAPTSVSRVSTLRANGDTLEVIGSTEDFGENERIFSTRFIGDRGYVVTFRQTDPLFVVDLADPSDPRVVGELMIPGFSNYLFPLDDDHLFAIGRDATTQGVVQGLALQIFDVSDPAAPALAHRYVFPDLGDSPANVDHRAISFHPAGGVVAFPHQSYTTGVSTLEVFRISSQSGFENLGAMGLADDLDLDVCVSQYFGVSTPEEIAARRAQVEGDPAWERELRAACGGWQYFRRALFRDDFVYGISNGAVTVYDFTAMAEGAVSELSLPAEVYDQGAGYSYPSSIPGRGAAQPGTAAPAPIPTTPAPAEAPPDEGARAE